LASWAGDIGERFEEGIAPRRPGGLAREVARPQLFHREDACSHTSTSKFATSPSQRELPYSQSVGIKVLVTWAGDLGKRVKDVSDVLDLARQREVARPETKFESGDVLKKKWNLC